MEWQPIETAPKDGTEILAYEASRYFSGFHLTSYGIGEPDMEEGWLTTGRDGDRVFFPTHWQPLPKAPE